MASEPAVLEAALPWVLHFVQRETVLAAAKYLICRRKPARLKPDCHMRHNLPVDSNGAQPDAMSGGIKVVVTTQSAAEEGQEHAGG